MPKNDQLRVRDLIDLSAVTVGIVVDAPVACAVTPGDRLLDEDDDVFLTVLLPGGVRADIMVTVSEYRAISRGAENVRAALATRPLELG